MYKTRCQHLISWVKTSPVGALLIKGEVDLFYYTGQHLSAGYLLASESGVSLHVDSRYFDRCKECCTHLDQVALLTQGATFSFLPKKKLGIDPSVFTLSEYLRIGKGDVEIEPLPSATQQKLRVLKSNEELDKLRTACQVTQYGLSHVLDRLREGVSEVKLDRELRKFWLVEYGAEPSFDPIIAFGENSANPHYTPGERQLKEGDPVLIDLGAKVEGYCADMTRVYFFGEPSEQMQSLYQAVLTAQIQSFEACKVGKKCGDIDAVARKSLAKKGLAEAFTHSLGHGIGLEIHEQPNLRMEASDVLQERMVFTLEPGAYLPGVGGVRIEDSVALLAEGPVNLTPFSKDPFLLN